MFISSRRQVDGLHLSHPYSYSNNKVYQCSHIQTSHLKKFQGVRKGCQETSKPSIYLKSLPSRPPAKLFTIFPPKARFAYVDAWLNLSLREKATVFVIVRTRAIATATNNISDPSRTLGVRVREGNGGHEKLTNQTKPDHTAQPDNRQNGQPDPKRWGRVQTQPEEPFIRRGDRARARVRRFKHPMRVARRDVDFVPPAETD